MEDLNDELKRLNREDVIWVIFIILSIFALVSDNFEKKWLINKNVKDYKSFKTINTILLVVSILIYTYFLILSYKTYKEKHRNGTIKEMFFSDVGFIAASLFLIAGIFNLWVETNTNLIDDELFL